MWANQLQVGFLPFEVMAPGKDVFSIFKGNKKLQLSTRKQFVRF